MSEISTLISTVSPEKLARLSQALKARAGKAGGAEAIRPRTAGNHSPLSFAQQRLWFIAQLEPDDHSYNCMEAMRISGELNLAALAQMLNEVVRRHEVLRTTFNLVSGEPMQVVASEMKLNLSVIDLRGLHASERAAQIERLSAEEAQRPFDLTHGPLLRATLLQVDEREQAVLFTTHHIVSDGWSMDVLTREALTLYATFATGQPSPLRELAIQYADFALWQRQRLTGQVLEDHLSYWRQQLAGAPPVLELPTDRPRPAILTHRGSYETLTLSPALSQSLKVLGRREGTTMFMTLVAAFDVLLSRYSGQADIVIGTDIANRNHGDTEALIGFFVNQLVLRLDLSGDPTFSELLQRVKEVTLNGYAHQDVPFERLVEMLNPERTLSHAPLFQVKLVLQNAPARALELPGIAVSGLDAESGVAKFDLTLSVVDEDGLISGRMEYNTDLFDSGTIALMLVHFERLLAAAVADPGQRLSQLQLLSEAERQQLLIAHNNTQVAYPHTRCVHQLFEEQAARSPTAIALTFAGQELSYEELNGRANQLAHYLHQLGIRSDTPVGVCLDRSIELIVALLAILKAGGAYVPLEPDYPTERLAFMLEDVLPPVVLTRSALADELPSTWAQLLCLDTEQGLWSALPVDNPVEAVTASDNLAYVIYTSGSTGTPKGVGVPHRAVVRLVKQSAYVAFGPREVFLQLAPVSFDASTLEIWGALLNGGRLVMMPLGTPDPDQLGAVLTKEGVTTLWLTAGLFHLMVEQQVEALAGVRQVVAGGDVLSAEHVRRLLRAKGGRGSVVNGYGPTETTTFACCHRMSGEGEELARGVPIGRPISNTQVYVLNEGAQLVGQGMVGELFIGGDGLARGYFNQPQLTAERFVPHPFAANGGERLYRTGDLVRWRADGSLEFLGRADTQVKVRGYRVEPGEVEVVLGRHAAVQECVVVPRREGDGEKRLVAYVVATAGTDEQSVNPSTLREYLRERLPDYMVPSAVVAVESLPLTSNGKVDRRQLAAREVRAGGGERFYVAPSTAVEEIMCGIWAEVLRAERVSIHDNFFDLGGDSILSIQVLVKARALGLEVTVQQLFQYQTIHELAQHLQPSDESSTIVVATKPFSLISGADRLRLPADVVDAYPLTALQAGMLFHSELSLDSAIYHDIFSFHLRVPLDTEALRAILQQLTDQHPVLRTSFNLSDFSEPLQLVHRTVDVPLQIEDLRPLSHAEQEEVLADWMVAEKRYHFNWGKAPVLRFHVHRRDDESLQFSFSFHHVILDGWSVAALLTDLFRRYRAFAGAETGPVEAPLSASFSDFVAAERAALNSTEARQYWKTRLNEATPSMLPRWPAAPQPAKPRESRMVQVDIPPELSQALKELARTSSVPIKSVLLAAHLRALNLLTGRADVLTGLVSHGRPETSDGENVLGLFLNTLPFRQRLGGGTWVDLVQETFRAEQELFLFRRYPMAQLQHDLGNDVPLFEVVFNFVHFHVYKRMREVGGMEVLGVGGFEQTNFTLAVNFQLDLNTSNIRLDLNYDASDLPDRQVEAVGRCYAAILEAMARDPLQRYEYQSLLPREERKQILFGWNDTVKEYPAEQGTHELFEQQAERTPEAIALVFESEQVSYRELNERANQLAHHLRQLGVGPEGRVGICVERSVEMVVGLLGILKAGGAYVPLDAQYPEERLRFMLADAQVGVLLTQEHLLARLPEHEARVVCLDRDWEEIGQQSEHNPQSGAMADNLAYIIYTSGSTGTPKGVSISHRAINRLVINSNYAQLLPSDKVAQASNVSFDAATFELWGALLQGAQLVGITKEVALSPQEFAAQLHEKGITTLFLTTALFNQLAREAPRAFASLRHLLFGGEAVDPQWVREVLEQGPPERLLHVYGPTESTTFATWHEVRDVVEGARTVPIGQPLSNTRTYVLDQRGQLAPVGVAGELHLGGAGLARGYWQRPELTAERFIPDALSGEAGQRLYRTGDLVRYLEDGELEYLGRLDHQVKVRGHRIELGEIEAVLGQYSGVSQSVVVAREDAPGQKQLVAYVLSAGELVSAGELRSYLREKLPEYMIPSFFVSLDELPLTPNGKVDRRALPAPEANRAELGQVYVAPRTPVEEMLAGLWASVLGVERVGVHDSFFELGGHSLLATQLVSRVRNTFSLELPLRRLFEQPTVADLAQVIESELRGEPAQPEPSLLPVPREGTLPLSYAQQRLWFLNHLMPESTAYNLPIALRLQGPLNVAALTQSLDAVIQRHEALRTVFGDNGGEPTQIVIPFRQASPPLFDLGSLTGPEQEAQITRLTAEEAERTFDLQRGPLMRVSLLRLGETEQVLLLTMHHIASDGWSLGVLTREVFALYAAFAAGQSSPLPELPLQYADFAVWQRGWLRGEVLEGQLDYWRRRLEAASVMELAADHPRPPVRGFHGATQLARLDRRLCGALKNLGREQGATLFMVLLAGLQAVLSRYTGQEDISVGTAVANRRRAELEGLIGIFVNTLVLRTEVSAALSFRDLLRRVREAALGAYAHQDVPFEAVVEALAPERDMSRNALFQVMFVMTDERWEMGEVAATEASGLQVREAGAAGGGAPFDLTLWATERDGEVRLSLQYSTDLFEARTARLLLQHLTRLLWAAVAEPERSVGALEMLGVGERRRLLLGWNETASPYPMEACVHELFQRQAAQTPAAVAVISGERELTYAELNAKANQLAHRLRRLGVGADALVGVSMDRSVEMVVAVLGVLKAGGASVPLDPAYPAERLRFMMTDSGARVLVTQGALTDDSLAIVRLDSDWAEIAAESTEDPESVAQPENLSYVIYTSGSTGQPKGVAVSHRALVNLLTSVQREPGLTAADTLLSVTTLSFDIAELEIYLPLLNGARLVVVDRETAMDGHSLAAALSESKATVMQATPTTWQMLLDSGWVGDGRLKMMSGGEVLGAELARRLLAAGGELWNMYAPSETTIYSVIKRVETVGTGGIELGRPIDNTQLYVLNAKMRLVPVGVAGELYIGGDGLARGYLHRADLTAERFVPHPFSRKAGARLYRTGDAVRYLPDGQVELLGRLDQQIKLRGFRIEPGEIEESLEQHPTVRAAVVVARDNAGADKRLVAYVTAMPEAPADPAVWRQHLEERLPSYMIPSAFVVVDDFPLTPSGKIDRRALPEPEFWRQGDEETYVAPRTPTEEVLTGLWASVLSVERVGAHDNFFALGGHSLLATQLVSRVRDVFRREVALRQVFENPTPAGFARAIDRAMRGEQESEAPDLLPVSRQEALPVSFSQRRLWFHDQLEPGNAAYNIPFAARLRGALGLAVLEQTLGEVVRRQEGLRTTFVTQGGQPFQLVHEPMPVKPGFVDLSGLAEAEREPAARRLAAAEAQRPFDLARGPLLRSHLLKLGAEDHILLLTMHHIVSDAWSVEVLMSEATTLYEIYQGGSPSLMPELKIQYPDYAAWQRNHFEGAVLRNQLDYWKRQLAGAPELLNLPTDKPRPPVQGYRGGQEILTLPRETAVALHELARRADATLFMVLLAAFQTFLSWSSKQHDIVVASPVAGRNRLEVEGLIGFFVNTLVLRTDLSGAPSFLELVGRVREVCLGAYAHQDAPFEALVETLAPERSLSYAPLSQVVFGLLNLPRSTDKEQSLVIEEFARSVEVAHADLELTVMNLDDGLLATLTYNIDLFEAVTVRRMLKLLKSLLAYIPAHPEATTADLSEMLAEVAQQERATEETEFKTTTFGKLKATRRRAVRRVLSQEAPRQ